MHRFRRKYPYRDSLIMRPARIDHHRKYHNMTTYVSRAMTTKKPAKKMCCTLRVFIFAYSLISVVVVVALISLVTLPRKTIMRLFCLKNRRIDGKRVTKWTSAIWLSVQRLIGPSNEIIMRLWNVTDRDHVAVWLSQGMTLCKRFALCKGIQDSLGFWIPRCGFRISGNSGFFCHWNLVSGSKR